jgi:hypothetical protein
MKKNENFWQLLKRLDQQAGEFNVHLAEANRYFDQAAHKTQTILERQEKELHETIAKVKKALKKLRKDKDLKKKKEDHRKSSS